MFEAMNLAILVGAGLIAISTFTSLISFRVGAPLLLVFLAVGLVAGVDGPGGLTFDDAPAAYFIGSVALAVILFDSGFNTQFRTVRAALGPALTLATVGVLLTAALVGAAAHLLLELEWLEALLLGAIVSSTDAAAVFFLLRVGGITLRDRVRSTLEVESGSNDPMAIFLTVTLVQIISASDTATAATGLAFLEAFARQMGFGLLAGLAGGQAIVLIIGRLKLEAGLYPIVVLSLALCVFAATGFASGSGYLAVYVAGVIAGNSGLQRLALLRRFQDGMTWFSQIAMFLTLGLLATPSQFLGIAWPAVALALFLTLVGRPIAAWLCLLPFGFTRNETTFVAWVGLRGAVSILLAILPIVAELPNGRLLFNVAFVVVIVSLVVQGWTIRPMARWLGLIVPPRIGPVERVELELPGRASHELITYRIAAESPVARGERVPRWARPSLIVRDGRTIRVHDAGRLRAGDYVYIFASPKLVHLLDRLFARPAGLDLADREFFGDFTIDPRTQIADLAEAYGFSVADEDATLSVADYVSRRMQGTPETGDRVPAGAIELIVREITDAGEIGEIGVALEPSRAAQPKLPVFLTWQEMRAFIRALRLSRRRRRQQKRLRRQELLVAQTPMVNSAEDSQPPSALPAPPLETPTASSQTIVRD
ncbi:MAG: potassium/proton antiporter [Rhodospirillales bacterium]|nr:potassium/proton antiporter [Rhodospirillales bacterium]